MVGAIVNRLPQIGESIERFVFFEVWECILHSLLIISTQVVIFEAFISYYKYKKTPLATLVVILFSCAVTYIIAMIHVSFAFLSLIYNAIVIVSIVMLLLRAFHFAIELENYE